MKRKLGVRIVALLVTFCPLQAVQKKAWSEPVSARTLAVKQVSDYKLGPGDLIEVTVFGVEDFNFAVRIGPTGTVNLPHLGRVAVAGLTVAQLEQQLKHQLDGRFIINPQVFVSIREYQAHPIFVLGAVNRPGQYQMIQPLTLLDVIAMAGGLDLTSADDYALIQRRRTENPGAQDGPSAGELEIIRAELEGLQQEGAPHTNPVLQPGDVVQVPARKVSRFFILGEVRNSGVYSLPDNQDLLVTQALAWAGGPVRTAKLNKGTLIRYDGNGGRIELAVDFQQILEGKKPDFAVQENDIIFIPGSRFKTIGYGLLGILPTMGSAVAYEGGRNVVR